MSCSPVELQGIAAGNVPADEESKELLRLLTCGSVDDGKSTLIGRLLYDTHGAYEDQLASVEKSSLNRSTGPIDFSLLTDGLRAEREQGITIDVAYRYFATPKRKFIIADTPGHEQYTRNMATGASTSHLAIILIDARQGVLPQSRRHAYIAGLLRIPHVIVAVNKMDLMGYRQDVFDAIRAGFTPFLDKLEFQSIQFIPVSALEGQNVAFPAPDMPWYSGPTLLEQLESVPVHAEAAVGLRYPVQYVNRPNLDFRGYAGQIASGVVRVGDSIRVLPSGRTSRVKSIVTFDGDLQEAAAPLSVTVCLEDEIDISRGDMLAHPEALPQVAARLEAIVVWMHEQPAEAGRKYLLKHTARTVPATIRDIRHRVDIHELNPVPSRKLGLNEIGLVEIETSQPLYFDPYTKNRGTGSFVLIDSVSNATVAAGMIQNAVETRRERLNRPAELIAAPVTPSERHTRHGHMAAMVWLPDRPEAAWLAERRLFYQGCLVKSLALHAEGAQALYDAGHIVLAIGAASPGKTDLGDWLNLLHLPQDDEEAADVICAALAQRGLLDKQQGFFGGDGI